MRPPTLVEERTRRSPRGADQARRVVTFCLLFTTLACSDETSELPRIGVSSPPSEEARDLAWSFDTITAVGELDGRERFHFVNLAGARVLPGGEFLILDSRGGRVALFDSTGQHLASVQSQGEGPGELQLPVALTTGDEGLFVLDRQLARLSRFRLDDGEIEFVGMSGVSQRMTSLCVLDDALWLGGLVDGRLAHRLDGEGTIEVSIGDPPTIEGLEELGLLGEALAYPQLVRPEIYCDDDRGLIVLASFSHPRVQAYRASGETVWSSDLPGITSIQFETTETGGLRHFTHPERGSHVVHSVVPWHEGQLLVQYAVRRDEQDDRMPSAPTMDSRIIDLATGHVLSKSTSLPPILSGRGDLFVISGQELFPQALLMRRVRK